MSVQLFSAEGAAALNAGPPPITYALTVIGLPAPQGSKSFMGIHGGKPVMRESSPRVKPWRKAIVETCRLHPALHLDGPLVVRMVFTMRKPDSAPKRRRTYPRSAPDLSKLCRAVEDALTDAGVITNDARIVEYERLAKVFPNEDPDALDVPGVRVGIREL